MRASSVTFSRPRVVLSHESSCGGATKRVALRLQVCALKIFRHMEPKYLFWGRTPREIRKIPPNASQKRENRPQFPRSPSPSPLARAAVRDLFTKTSRFNRAGRMKYPVGAERPAKYRKSDRTFGGEIQLFGRLVVAHLEHRCASTYTNRRSSLLWREPPLLP